MLQLLLDYFVRFGYWVVFIGVMLENAGLPVPGETIMLAGGFFAARGHFELQYVIIIGLIGAVLGDNAGYWIGRILGRQALERYGRYIFLTAHRLEKVDRFFHRFGGRTIFIARFVTGLRVFAALIAGSTLMPWQGFLLFNIAGAVVWSVTIALIGFLFGEHWEQLMRIVHSSGIAALVIGIFLIVSVWLYKKWHRRLINDET
jgi:membrane protein DedA with SNARE-associated domain